MSVVEQSAAAVVSFDVATARRRAERIRLLTGAVAENLAKVRELVHEAKESNDHLALGYDSWTAYIADLFGDEPLRLAREVRRELVAELAEQGMSTRAIAPIVGVSHTAVRKDIAAAGGNKFPGVTNVTPDPAETVVIDGMTVTRNGDVLDGPIFDTEPTVTEHTVTEKVKTITGLDGKEYQRPEPAAPRRRAITDQARDIGWDIRKQAEKVERLFQDDRFGRNKEEMAPHLRSHLEYVIRVCQDSLDHLNK